MAFDSSWPVACRYCKKTTGIWGVIIHLIFRAEGLYGWYIIPQQTSILHGNFATPRYKAQHLWSKLLLNDNYLFVQQNSFQRVALMLTETTAENNNLSGLHMKILTSSDRLPLMTPDKSSTNTNWQTADQTILTSDTNQF